MAAYSPPELLQDLVIHDQSLLGDPGEENLVKYSKDKSKELESSLENPKDDSAASESMKNNKESMYGKSKHIRSIKPEERKLKIPIPEFKFEKDSINDKLYAACIQGNISVIKPILDKHFRTLMPDENGQTPLFAACMAGKRDVVKFLVQYGYDVHHQDNEGKTPLHIAFECEEGEIAKDLIRSFKANIKQRDKRNWTPLHSAVDRGYLTIAERLLDDCLEYDMGTDVSWLHLQAASYVGDLEKIKFLLDTKADINAVSSDGLTALFIACKENRIDVVDYLIEQGADPNIVCKGHRTVLHYSVTKIGAFMVQRILQAPTIDLTIRDDDGDTALHLAAYKRNIEILTCLCERGADKEALNAKHFTPLLIAVHKTNLDMVLELVRLGADVNAKDEDGDTCLHLAVHRKRADLLQILLPTGNPNIRDKDGDTVLHIATYKNNAQMVHDLVACDAEVNAKNHKDITPLEIACAHENDAIIKILLEANADPDLADKDGDTCLHILAGVGNLSSLQMVLKHGANIDAVNYQLRTPLFTATSKGHTNIVRALLDKGADPNIVSAENLTCLHRAVREVRIDIVRLLLTYDLDVNVRDNKLRTPLFLACALRNETLVDMLLELSADTNIPNFEGVTCLHVAMQYKQLSTAEKLVEKGADLNPCNKNGSTPLLLACSTNCDSTVKWLLEKGADVNIACSNDNAPLHIAIANNFASIMQCLLDKGANVNLPGQHGMTALHIACLASGSDSLAAVLRYNPHTSAVDNDGDTGLHITCRKGYTVNTKMLLDYGINVEVKNFAGRMPFEYAVRRNDIPLIELIMEKYDILNALMESYETPLHYYCRKGEAKMVKFVLDKGADVDKACIRGSPLDIAFNHNHIPIVRQLIAHGADIVKPSVNKFSFIEKLYKVRKTHAEFLETIISENQEVDLSQKDEQGNTLFHKACMDEAANVVKLLLKRKDKIGINSVNKLGKTAVYILCQSKSIPLLSSVLNSSHDVDVDIADIDQLTPLHIACMNGDIFTANMLLRKSTASVMKVDNMDRTPLHFATNPELVTILLRFGGDPMSRDYIGRTPLLLHCQQGEKEVALALLKQDIDVQTRDNMLRNIFHHCVASKTVDILSDVTKAGIDEADINQFTPLHIAALNDDYDTAKKLLEMGADPNKSDKSDLTPIHLAGQRLGALLKNHAAGEDCISKRGSTVNDMLAWRQQMVEHQQMTLWTKLVRRGETYIDEILNMPLIGLIDRHERQEKEYLFMKSMLKDFMKRLSEEIKRIDPLMEFQLMPSGSMNEDTKVGIPDEGDFVCILFKVSNMLIPPRKFSFQNANVMLRISEAIMDDKPDFVDSQGRVVTQLLFRRFYNAVQLALGQAELWEQFPQLYRTVADDITHLQTKISHVNLMWHGNIYKWIPISVDIVPGIVFNNWMPEWCEEREVLEVTQCCIVAKDIGHAPDDKRPYLLQLGFTDSDAAMFRRMCPEMKEGYMVAKLMRQKHICPLLKSDVLEIEEASCYISSYMLKTATFHLHEEYLASPERFTFSGTVPPAVEFARLIYARISKAFEENFLEMYTVPAHDILRNHFTNRVDFHLAEKYCKRIRMLLNKQPDPDKL